MPQYSLPAEDHLPQAYVKLAKTRAEALRKIHGEEHLDFLVRTVASGTSLLRKHRARYLQLPGIESRCAKPREAEILVLLQDPWAMNSPRDSRCRGTWRIVGTLLTALLN